MAANVIPFIPGAEGFSMRRKALKQTINAVYERWATYREGSDPTARQVADNTVEAQAKRFEFMTRHIASAESNVYGATVWLRVPVTVGNPFGIGAEFSGRTLAQAVDAAMNHVNLTK